MKRSVMGIFCVLALLFSCGLPVMAADTTTASSETIVETAADGKTGEVWMVLGIFTVTAVVTASAVIIPKWKKLKAAQKQKTNSEEKTKG